MFFFTYTAAILALICFASATFILSRKPKDIMARYFVFYLYAVTLWIGSNALADVAKTPFTNILWSGMAFIGVNFFVSFYLCFTHVFVFHRRPSLKARAVYFLPTIFFSLSAFSKYSIADTLFPPNAPSAIVPGPFYTYYLYFSSILYALILLIWFAIRRASKQERRQALFMGIGATILFASSVFFGDILPVFFNEFRFFNVGPQFVIFLIAFSSYAILRHRLFDIQLLIKKGAVFTALFAIIIVFFNTTVSLSATLLPAHVSLVMAALVITVIFSPLKAWLEKTTDKIFFRHRISFHEMINRLNHSLDDVKHPSDFIRNVHAFVHDVVKIDQMAFLVADEQGILRPKTLRIHGIKRLSLPQQNPISDYISQKAQRNEDPLEVLEVEDIDYRLRYEDLDSEEKQSLQTVRDQLVALRYHAMIPFVSADKIEGLLFLGSKLSGDQLGEPDFRILEALAHEGSITLQKAIDTERANRLNELKSEFVRVVSHQLRTPLSAAKWNTDFLMEQKLTKTMASPMADIQINLSKISDGLTSMLTVMEIAEDRIDVKKAPFNPVDLAKSVVKNFETLAKLKKVTVKVATEEPELSVEADLDKIRKVMSILVANAIMYTAPKTRVDIMISDGSKLLKFAVEDHGMGVAKKDRQEIFEKFFRGEEAKRMAPDGLGVSLYIARDFITRHGGKLWVEDRKDGGSGARFVFTLPL